MNSKIDLLRAPSTSRTIFANTWLLYLRAGFTLVFGLFSTRYVLDALGTHNFGIYSLVGSIIAFLSFINNSMAEATTRFLSFHQKDAENGVLKKVFNTSMALQLLIATIIVLSFEIAGLFLFRGILNIDAPRIHAAKFVYHCMIASAFFTILGAPFDGCIIAHERFIFFTAFSAVETICKFIFALALYITPFDRLETFGFLMAALAFAGFISRWSYSHLRFHEARINVHSIDLSILKKLASFSLWILFDLMSNIFKFNLMDLLLNTFLGTLANAAFAVSKQVSGALLSFSGSIFSASRPQIVRSVSCNDSEGAIKKTLSISRLAFLLMSLLTVPLLVEMPTVLRLWLKDVPEYSTTFCQLSLISNLISLMTIKGFSILLDGIGRIRAYRSFASFCNLMAFPIAYLLLRHGLPPYAIFYGILSADLLLSITTIYFVIRYSCLTWPRYIFEIPIRLIPIVGIVIITLCSLPWPQATHPLIRLTLTSGISTVLLVTLFWFVLNKEEKYFAIALLNKLRNRYF